MSHLDFSFEPLMNDGLEGQPPAKRVLEYVRSRKERGAPVAGVYCAYAPLELMQAMGIVPAVLCAFSRTPIESAESVLPANLCPLIKSSYGFVLEGTCPFFAMADIVIAETTCDGKKKMFELLSEVKPVHVMDLPQLPEEAEAVVEWRRMIVKLKDFLEGRFKMSVSDPKIEKSLQMSNRKNRLVRRIFDYAAVHPPVISREEMYEVSWLALPSRGEEIIGLLEELVEKLDRRLAAGHCFGTLDSPRVLVTGSPVSGDAAKIFKVIEEAGGVVVVADNCTGSKPFNFDFAENTGDPIGALAQRYLKIPCACMSPNTGRLDALSEMIEKFRPDVVVDFILQACHAYNVESYKIGEHVTRNHHIPFLKVESDYSETDIGQLKTRIEALFETLPGKKREEVRAG